MSSKVQFKSDAFEAIHASASALHKVGAMDKATMRSFDETCLSTPPELKPEHHAFEDGKPAWWRP